MSNRQLLMIPFDPDAEAIFRRFRLRASAWPEEVAGSLEHSDSANALRDRFRGTLLWGALEAESGAVPPVLLLENGSPAELRRRGLSRPAIAAIGGLRKPWLTRFSSRDYEAIRRSGDDHRRQYPRRIRE